MHILIVAATESEIKPFLQYLEAEKLRDRQVETLVTGVGMTATAFHLGRKLASSPCELILNAGIAGSFDRSLPLGTVVQVTRDCLAELGAEDGKNFISIGQLGFGESCFSTDREGTIEVPDQQSTPKDPLLEGLPRCEGITVNTVHGEPGSIRAVLGRHPQARVESMEGAAVFYAARQSGIPAIQVRAISNYVEERNRETWDIPLAIARLNGWLCDFIKSKSEVK